MPNIQTMRERVEELRDAIVSKMNPINVLDFINEQVLLNLEAMDDDQYAQTWDDYLLWNLPEDQTVDKVIRK